LHWIVLTGKGDHLFSSFGITTGMVENLNVLVREDLDRETPSILLLTSISAIAKYALVSRAKQQKSLIGLLLNLVTVATENADLRS